MVEYPKRHWGLVSLGAGAGKSTFTAANAEPPVYPIDSDNRYPYVAPLINGDVFYPSPAGRGVGPEGPLLLMTEAEEVVFSKNINTIVVDSVTKIYEMHSRRASMAGRLSPQRRKEMGYGKQKASDMVNKSNIMSVLSTLVTYGTNVYYTWHERSSIDVTGGTYDKLIRSRISDVEMETLMTSIAVVLQFERMGTQFSVYVKYARDFGGRKANTGFTIYDEPGNFWKGAAERLERLMYTSFLSKDEAIRWGMRELKNDDPGEIGGLFDHVKSESRAKNQAEMWVAWVEHVDGLRNGREAQKEPVIVTPPKPVPVVAEPPPEPQTAAPRVVEPEDMFPDDVEEPAAVVEESLGPPDGPAYGDGNPVLPEDEEDFNKYTSKFGKVPSDQAKLYASMKWAKDNDAEW